MKLLSRNGLLAMVVLCVFAVGPSFRRSRTDRVLGVRKIRKTLLHSSPISARCIFLLLFGMSEPYSSPPIVLLSPSSNVLHAFISPRLFECCFLSSRHPPRFLMDQPFRQANYINVQAIPE